MSCLCAALFELSSGKEQKEPRRPRASPSKFLLLCPPPDATGAGLGVIAAAPDCPPRAEQFGGSGQLLSKCFFPSGVPCLLGREGEVKLWFRLSPLDGRKIAE